MFARRAASAGIAAVAAVGLAAPASASPEVAVFLDRLQKVGITSSNPYATIYDAYAVCRELDRGTSPTQVVGFVLGDNPDLDWEAAADYVVLANMTYCPPV
ncbi:DUF732 domain-containing protein [Mycolicibacterium sp. PAM1]|uniref:DUF732 domain-containing protein n=1 Tax=Mycolicibacterium gilvum (strain PYR-GCK) TaxID=350054 RepID=A4T1F6_MYCGI|nr:DUF732 domain-containing protein [Mycolicibacterium sp. PAM1]ABP47651.1 protein of unknown function DUF732 [Mycolicibacterium gilvum PYR-GCK]MBV5246067.1 DUF732 domain-containing protein [Mycolicibacterium sp. PAM1]